MSSLTDLIAHQKTWAADHGLAPDENAYLSAIEKNLFQTLSERTRQSFIDGSGGELVDSPKGPAKMKALYSSSALAVNVFDFWVTHDKTALSKAMYLDDEIVSISFEGKFPTGLRGTPPNLDIVLALSTGHVVGIESKFSEWLRPKSASEKPFAASYFRGNIRLWEKNGLPNTQILAQDIAAGKESFRYLNVAQLLKHSLGLSNRLGRNFSLHYMYYDWPGIESTHHKLELVKFADLVGAELKFHASSYQDFFRSLLMIDGAEADYLSYLGDRYFN